MVQTAITLAENNMSFVRGLTLSLIDGHFKIFLQRGRKFPMFDMTFISM